MVHIENLRLVRDFSVDFSVLTEIHSHIRHRSIADHKTSEPTNFCIVFAFRCAGLSDVDLKFGPCWNDNPCAGDHNCKSGEKCIPARQVCLTMLKRSCVQYKCSKCPQQRSINDQCWELFIDNFT